MSSPARKRPSDRHDGAGRSLLVLAQPSQEIDDLLSELVARRDLHVLRAVTVEAAAVALRDLEISLMLVCSQTSLEAINDLLRHIDRFRPGIPVLALRERGDEESPSWKARTVGVLRLPLLPDVLRRTVDVALGLADRSEDE